MKTSDLINTGSKILKERNIPTHRIDSEIILSHILKKDRERILINEDEITKNQFEIFNQLLTRRLNNEPIAYIINKKEFRSNSLYVAKNSLIPRPETELLIDPIISIFKRRKLYFLDAGIGTGCIIFSILNELKCSKGVGIDICNKAISVAKINLKNFKFSQRVKLHRRSIDQVFYNKFDLVVSNPPYVVRREINRLSDDIKKFEPKKALNGGNDGLDVIRKVIYKSKNILKYNGILALEIGTGQYLKVIKILKKNNYKITETVKDYKNNIRCIFSTLL